MQKLVERHVAMTAELDSRMEAERQALKDEASAMAAAAAASGEERGRATAMSQ